MKIKALSAFFTKDYKAVGCNELIDIEDRIAKQLIDIGYAIPVEENQDVEVPKKKSTSTRKKKVEVE